MVLDIGYVALSSVVPSTYWLRVIVGIVIVYIIRAFSQGRKTTRERDLHARTVLVTGAFTPLGLTILRSLAERGAHIIALSPDPITSPKVDILISLLRSTTNNERIFAEECNLSSAESVRSFCTRFLTSEENRLDALIFAHEYTHIGSIFLRQPSVIAERERQMRSLATFLMITLLLPVLLVAPSERDIRIINVVNPFYAAAIKSFSPSIAPPEGKQPIFVQEGRRSLQMVVLTRHLQRILDSLPHGSQVPKTDENAVPVVSAKLQQSNIVSVSVSPGISRKDTIAQLLAADWTDHANFSYFGLVCYMISQPFLRVFTRSSNSTLQTVLHALFLPTPFKSGPRQPGQDELATEVLKPGSMYADCSVVNLGLQQVVLDGKESKGKEKASMNGQLPDDGELGGEALGRQVWENFEQALKIWEQIGSSKSDSSTSSPKTQRDENSENVAS